MKKLFTAILFLITLTSNAQVSKNNPFIGQWTSNGDATEIIVRINDNKKLEVLDFSSVSGTALVVLEIKLTSTKLIINTVFEENNWYTKSEFTLVDNNTLRCKITGDGEDTVTYKRVH